jgi:hypothetical protein
LDAESNLNMSIVLSVKLVGKDKTEKL